MRNLPPIYNDVVASWIDLRNSNHDAIIVKDGRDPFLTSLTQIEQCALKYLKAYKTEIEPIEFSQEMLLAKFSERRKFFLGKEKLSVMMSYSMFIADFAIRESAVCNEEGRTSTEVETTWKRKVNIDTMPLVHFSIEWYEVLELIREKHELVFAVQPDEIALVLANSWLCQYLDQKLMEFQSSETQSLSTSIENIQPINKPKDPMARLGPAIGLFCKLVNESGLIPKGSESIPVYCKTVCDTYKIQYRIRLRSEYGNKPTKENRDKMVNQILPNLDPSTKDHILNYLAKAYPSL